MGLLVREVTTGSLEVMVFERLAFLYVGPVEGLGGVLRIKNGHGYCGGVWYICRLLHCYHYRLLLRSSLKDICRGV